MSKSASYTINAKDKTKQGINSAKSGLDGLNKTVKSFGVAIGAAFSVAAIKKVGQEIEAVNDAFGVQLESEIQLQKAVLNSSKLSLESAANLKKFASELQSTSIFGDEQLIQYEAMLAAQGRTEEEIQNVLQASVDLASTGVMPLESAVKNISKTYAGMAGELGESIPALKDLTKEQMKNGEAVELIARQYEGMGAAVAKGAKGTKQALANTKGDIQETLGEIFTNITGDTNARLLPIFNKINEWLQGNKTQIINVFRNIPELAATTFNLIKDVIGQILTPEFFMAYGTIMWDFFLTSGKYAITTISDFIKAIGISIWEPLKYGFQVVTTAISNGFGQMINFFIDKLNWFMEQYNKLAESGAGRILGMESAELFQRANTNKQAPQNNIKNNIREAWDNAFSRMKDGFPEVTDAFTEAVDSSLSVGADLFGDEFNKFLEETEVILNKPLEIDYKEDQLAAITGNGGGGTGGGSGAGGGLFAGLFQNLGGFSNMLGSAGGVIGVVISVFTSLINGIASLSAIFNFFQTIIDGLISTIAVPLNEILAPMVGSLYMVGEIIGQILIPILNLLTPVLDFVSAGFLFLYNYAIRPLANAIIWVVVGLNNAVANAINAILKAIDKIPFVKMKYRMDKMDYDDVKMDKISMDDLRSKGEEYITNNGGSTGYETTGGASYSQARDVYITINMDYQVGLSAFDDNDIAVKINNSLERAKSLGYI